MTERELHRRAYRPEARGILDGVRILDLSRLFAGNVLTQMLGDFGAEVIKVEPPEGDTLRAWKTEGVETHWKIYARNKKSLCLSLRDPRAVEELEHVLGPEQHGVAQRHPVPAPQGLRGGSGVPHWQHDAGAPARNNRLKSWRPRPCPIRCCNW
mgnify:CR=1 FL=1